MGEVYKARDTRIDRTVAIKVLPTQLAGNAELKQRFEREAKSISTLNHPHICTLYEFDSHDGTDYLVMEHLEGESLAERISRKGSLPLDEAIRTAVQIAHALDAAHRHGVVHRDLKPGNIMLAETGAKLLDFGLAKLADPATGAEADVPSSVPTEAQPLTEKGAILGTFQYMAPEQLEGEASDARTDIFAFGAVIYEMVTGKRAFEGKTQASLIGAILEREPQAMTSVQPLAPRALERIVRKCLAKAPHDRYHSAHDLADELTWVGEPIASDTTIAEAPGNGHKKLGVSFLLGALVAGLALFSLSPNEAAEDVARFVIPLPESIRSNLTTTMALAPDGSRIAYISGDRIHVRELGELEARPLAGTEGDPRELEFSPDSQWVAYWSSGELKKVAASGGAPLRLGEIEVQPFGLTWTDDDVLHFGGGPTGDIWQIPATGGTPSIGLQTTRAAWRPQLLPDGRTYLFMLPNGIAVQSPNDNEPRMLHGPVLDVRYLESGHLLFQAPNDLLAVPFDATRVELTGSPVPIVQGSDWQFDVARNGTLVYLPAGAASDKRLVWVDRSGAVTPAVDERQAFVHPQLSVDDRRVAVSFAPSFSRAADIWVYELTRGTRTRVTTESARDENPIWSPDGERIVFMSPGEGLLRTSADGSGAREVLLKDDTIRIPRSFSPEGKRLAFTSLSNASFQDLGVLDLETQEAEPFVVAEFMERSPTFSPDGRLVAYVSNASGRREIYVEPYPGPGPRVVISTEGGYDPVWSRDGGELFYRNGDQMMAVPVTRAPQFSSGVPEVLFEREFLADIYNSGGHSYDVAADGRFLMIESGDTREELHIVLNWLEELEARVPGAR